MLLSKEIENLQAQMIPNIPKDALDIIMRTSEELIKSNIDKKALKTGDKIEDFQLITNDGSSINTKALRNVGPVVISFFRGNWCPYCNLELQALNKAYDDIRGAKAELIAISPDLQKDSDTSKFKFPVLVDEKNNIAKKFNLVFQLDAELRPIYQQFGFDIPKSNGDQSYEIPIPATYIINQSGEIIFDFISADYTKRCEPSIIVDFLKSL